MVKGLVGTYEMLVGIGSDQLVPGHPPLGALLVCDLYYTILPKIKSILYSLITCTRELEYRAFV